MDEMFGFMDNGEAAEPQTAPPVPAPDDPVSVIVPDVVNGALAPQAGADPLEEARRLVKPWQDRMPTIKEAVNKLQVSDEHSLAVATIITGRSKKLNKALDDARKSLVGPLNQKVAGINATFKQLQGFFSASALSLESKIGTYTAKLQMEHRRVEAEARKAAEELQKKVNEEAKELVVEPIQVQAPVVQQTPKVIRTEEGTAGNRTTWAFEIVDEAQVPRDYLCVDEKKIRAAVRGGVRTIAGVRIFEDTKTVVRSH